MDVSALLAMVHADPRDLAARAVYADALLEAGDPRGELIALQLERARSHARPSPRELELFAKHGAAWLGPLAGVIDHDQVKLENGFLRAVGLIGGRPPMTDAVLDHPEWRSVEILAATAIEREPALWHEPAELLARLPQLATLTAGPSALRVIGERVATHGLARLSLMPTMDDLQPLFALIDRGTLPDLRVVRLASPPLGERDLVQLGARLGRAVELELVTPPTHPERVAQLLASLVSKVRAVIVRSEWGHVRASLTDGSVAIRPDDPSALHKPALRAILDQLGTRGYAIEIA